MVIALAAAFLLCNQGRADGLNDLLQYHHDAARNLVIPLYTEPARQLCLITRIQKASLEYERKGFFHIGILPIGVLDRVSIEFQDAATAPGALGQLQRWLGADGGRRVELRQVKFLFQSNIIEAGRVECRVGRWELSDGVRVLAGGREARADRATLDISNGAAGKVALAGDSPVIVNLFDIAISQPKQP